MAITGLPHYTQSKASRNLYEPVHKNLFEVTILPPSGVAGSDMLLEHVLNIGGLDAINPSVDAVGQKYKFADRSFAGMPGQTFLDVSITFSLNLNDANQMYIYKTIQDWYKKMYNPATGEMGLKKEYTGTMVVVEYNRKGDIYRKITLKDVFLTGTLGGPGEHDYTATDPIQLAVTIRCDHWDEELT